MIEWYLEAENGDADLIQIIELKEFRSYTVGRKRDFDIISVNPLVSRTHGLFKHKVNNKIYVHDSNSSNGIWVNDEKITPGEDHLVNENDLIGIGTPSSAQEARLELFRLRGTHLITDSDNIPKLNPKEKNTHNETTPPTVSNADVSPGNEKKASNSPKVSNNEEDCANDIKQSNGPNKIENVSSQDTNSTSSSRNAMPIIVGDVKAENNLKDDKKHCVEMSHETPTHSENNGEHVFSFPEDESEHIIPKYERCLQNSHPTDSASKIINLDEEQYEEKIVKDNSVKNKIVENVVPCKELIPVVRLDRLELASSCTKNHNVQVADQPKKKLEVISPSSSDVENENVDDTNMKHKHVNTKFSNKSSSEESPDGSISLKKYFDKLSHKKTSKVSKSWDKHIDISDEESYKPSVHNKHGKLISKSKPKKTESSSSEKVKRKVSLFEELFGKSDSREKQVEKSVSKERKTSSDSSSSNEKLVSYLTSKPRVKPAEKSACKERKLSSASSNSTDTPISFLTSASRVKSSEKSASKTSYNSSSSEDEAIPRKRSNSREKQKLQAAGSRIISDSSDYSDKSSPTERTIVRENEIKTKKSTTHSTDKPVSLERSDSKEKQLKMEMTDHISLDSKDSNTSQESEVSVNVKISITKDLFSEVRNLKQVKSESILQTAQDIQEASTSKIVPSVEEVRSIKLEIFEERQLFAERQPSPIMCASHVSISSDSDESSPAPKPKVPSEVNNSIFSINCDVGEIICLSDDDDIFPKSQMFDDAITVKDEPLSRNEREEDITIKSEQHSEHEDCADEYPMPENDDNIFGIIKKDVEFDDDAILVDDDENDEVDSLWYSRLSQPGFSSSQLEEPQEQFDDKNIISIRTGPKVLNFLDDKDLITNERNEALGNELQERVDFDKESFFSPRTVELRQDAEDAEDAADITDDSVPICVVIHSIEPRSSRSAIIREPTVDELDATSKLDEIKSKISTKISYAKPPVIDAPHLIKGRRKTTEEIKPKGLNKRGRKRKQSVDERATTAVAPVPVRTFGTGTNLDKSVVNELHKRHKRRRPSTDILPKDKKLEIREERMKKLKEIAQKTTDDKKEDEKPKNTAKPYIKLSSSRGLFLTDEGPVQETEKRKIRVRILSELEPQPKKKFIIPKTKIENNKVVEEVNTLAVPSTSKDNTVNIDNNKNEMMHQIPNTVIEEENQNAITEKSTKKRVTFSDMPQIRVYIIDEGNHMNKCTSKDAPLPRKVIQTEPPTRIADDLPENIVLCDILSWVPIWLEEQKNINAAPKLSMHKPIQMLHTFNTHGDYCNIVIPLLLLELWRSVFKDWINSRKPVMLATIDDVQSMYICRMNMLSIHCHSVITRLDSDRYLHPVRGDLLVIEILLGDTNRQCAVIKKLGYVVDITKRRLNANDLINSKLIHTTMMPEFLVHYKIMLKDFNTEINRDRMIRIRAISRIGTSLRIFKSVSLLNKSALCKFILNPQVNDYKVPKLTQTKLVISDKLDADQVKCMVEAVQMCVRPEPGIYMIQGPPGTGKSRLIKNIVHQLIYGERKPGTKPNCILLCAPSNGAIDELARKLLEMRQSLPQEKRFRMVRLGPPNSIHPKVKPVSLPCLVDAFVQKQLNFKREANDAVLDDLHFRQSKINMLKNKLVSLRERNLNTSDVEIQLQKAKNDLELFHNRSKREMTYQERKALERTSEETVITKADIVCSTLSSCVASRMEEMYHRNLLHFTCCIIDEATQSGEQETLIPLILGIKRLILVGDPAQLPATVLSQEAKQLGYGNSLFYRIQKCFEHLPENPIRMLKTQYRMHPDICKFPNEHFYYGKLINSSAFIDNRNANIRCMLSHRYRVFALRASQQHSAAHAYFNVPEAQFVLVLTKLVLARTDYSVGIITPYTKQREYLQRGLQEITKKTDKGNDRVTVNTVDGFQGQERDVIIMSCVRHNSNMFLADQQRLNVSLTRAKHALFICANAELFKNDDIWTKLEQDATKRYCLKYLTKTDYENEKYVTSLLYNS